MKEKIFQLKDCNVGKRTKKWHFSKSKILLIFLLILGLVYYGCHRRRVSNPYDATNNGKPNRQPAPAGTFSVTQAGDNNTDNFIVKTANTVGEIKIGFISDNNYPYTLKYEIEDEDKTEANRITTADTEYTNDIFTIKESGLDKIRKLDSSSGLKSKTITVYFIFTAEDTNLNNNMMGIPVAVTLKHAQTFSDNNATNTFIETALKKGSALEDIATNNGPDKVTGGYSYGFDKGKLDDRLPPPQFTFEITNSVYTNTSDTSGSSITESPVAKSLLKKLADTSLKEASASVEDGDSPIPEISKSVFSKEEVDNKSYSLTYKVTWEDIYDLSETEITIKFVSKEENKFTDDTPPTPTPPETTTRSIFRF